jgi:hypothetical protein
MDRPTNDMAGMESELSAVFKQAYVGPLKCIVIMNCTAAGVEQRAALCCQTSCWRAALCLETLSLLGDPLAGERPPSHSKRKLNE